MRITNDIKYVGVNDHKIDLFEGQYEVPLGMAYNSYVILDEKIAVFDSVEADFGEEWLENIENALEGKTPDYLIVQHMEPDHSANIRALTAKYPQVTVVGNAKTFTMMNQFYGEDAAMNKLVVKNGDTLSLGRHELLFVFAPMVHWPEVMMTYDKTDKVFFSADAFGKFGANDVEDPEGWACEARRYYFGIVGKYGAHVQKLFQAIQGLEIKAICPLHGPVLDEDLDYYLTTYNTWSSYEPEDEGVFIAYTSVYGHTKEAAELLAEKLEEKGCPRVAIADLAREDMFECVEDAFRHSKLVLATTTYNNDCFPFMKTFIDHLVERGFQNREVAFIENGTWAPQAAKRMKGYLEGCPLTFAETTVTIKSALTDANREAIDALAAELVGTQEEEAEAEAPAPKKWVCSICGYVYEGDALPEDYECPVCGVGPDLFEEA